MRKGSLVIFDQPTTGQVIVGLMPTEMKQIGLFDYSMVLIQPGDCGVICSLQEANMGKMLLADVLIGDTLVFDIDLNTAEVSVLS